jgi:hypothetical protein
LAPVVGAASGYDVVQFTSEQLSQQSEYDLAKFEIQMIDCDLDADTRAEALAVYRTELDAEQANVMGQLRAWLESGVPSPSVTFKRRPPPLN